MASIASRRATSRIDGRVATTLEESHLPEERSSGQAGEDERGRILPLRDPPRDLELAPGDDVRSRGDLAFAHDLMAGRHRDHVEYREQLAQRFPRELTEEGQGSDDGELATERLADRPLRRLQDLSRLGCEGRTREKRAEWPEPGRVGKRTQSSTFLEAVGPQTERARDPVEVLRHVHPERSQIPDGGDRERQVPGCDRQLDGGPETVDGGSRSPHLPEEKRRHDERTGRRRLFFQGRRPPSEGRLGLVGEKKRESVVDGGVARASRQLRR
jgi:hypothetical protein